MVNLMVSELIALRRYTGIYKEEEQMDHLLTFIQSMGMSPPLNNWDYNMDGDKADINNIKYRTWEQE